MEKYKISETQKITRDTYEKNLDTYISGTPQEVNGEFKEQIDHALSYLENGARILELGSGTGRDADYIESKGYFVTRTDVVQSFIDYQKTLGKQILYFDAISDRLPQKFDAVFALAVFLHFTKEECSRALDTCVSHINEKGLIVLRMKTGEGEEYSSSKMGAQRYFKYWNAYELEEMVLSKKCTIIQTFHTTDMLWFCIIAQYKMN